MGVSNMSEAWVVSAMLAVGLMAQAWAQSQALAEQAQQRMQWVAINLAVELDARMRSHPQTWSPENNTLMTYALPLTPLTQVDHPISGDPEPTFDLTHFAGPSMPVSCQLHGCSGPELAQWDVNMWLARAQQQLPQGWVHVQVHALQTLAGLGPRWSITVGWPGNESGWSLHHGQP